MAEASTAELVGAQAPISFKSRAGGLLERSGIPILLVITIVYFGIFSSSAGLFRSSANIENILANQSVTGLIALGMVAPMIAGYFDVSVAAIAGLANVTSAALIGTYHEPIAVGVFAALLVALVGGGVNAILVAVLRLDPFICTLGTYVLYGGILQLYTQGNEIGQGVPVSLGNWGSGKLLGVARPFWLLIVVALVLWWILMQTPFGRKLAAIGSNEAAARLAGIRVRRSLILGYLLAALLAGMAGVLLTIQNGGADATTATSFLFPSLAAVFLGQTAISPGRSNVWGTMFGVFFVAVAVNGLTLLGAQAWITQVFNGAALLASVSLSVLMKRFRIRGARNLELRSLHAEQGDMDHAPNSGNTLAASP